MYYQNKPINYSGISNNNVLMKHDNLDKKLINELLGNGRASLRSIGEKLDISVTTVSNRISDLETADIIEGYTPIVNYSEAGYNCTAVIHLKVEGSALPDIVDRLRDQKQMTNVYEVTGDYDIIAVGKYKHTRGMNTQIKDLIECTYIRDSNTSIVLNVVEESGQFELDVSRTE